MANNIDLNEIGRQSYKLLCKEGGLPNKEKSEMTLEERVNLVNHLTKMLKDSIEKIKKDRNKYEFLSYLYMSVILYLDDLDLNKYLKISVKES